MKDQRSSWGFVLEWLGIGLVGFIAGPFVAMFDHTMLETVGIGLGWLALFLSAQRTLIPAVRSLFKRVRPERLWKEE